MAVYVDDARLPYGRLIMSHMWADSRAELLAMADRIGVARHWLQEPPKASWLHFDVCQAKREAAIRAGAIVTDRYGPREHLARIDAASRDPAQRRRGEIVLDQIARSRARRTRPAGELPLFGSAS